MTRFHRSSEDRNDLARVEIPLRRALATADSDESRYHIRSALQQLVVLREAGAVDRSEYGDIDDLNRQ
ncbi:hypothetical protein [Halobaculum sp. EA56]|uniref:hypothetical protein n=1 Tax=Halobaculum sp. EA56 TaxID=3421648 RepID=UPI003EBC4398